MSRDNEPARDDVAARAATSADTRSDEPRVIAEGADDRGRSQTDDANPNASRLEDRRGTREEGRPVRITVNDSFAQEVGPEATRAYVDVLARVAETASGDAPGDVTDRLLDAWSNAGIQVDRMEASKIGEMIADHTRGRLVVVDSRDNVLHGRDVTDGEGGDPSARQDEPADPDRPFYS